MNAEFYGSASNTFQALSLGGSLSKAETIGRPSFDFELVRFEDCSAFVGGFDVADPFYSVAVERDNFIPFASSIRRDEVPRLFLRQFNAVSAGVAFFAVRAEVGHDLLAMRT